MLLSMSSLPALRLMSEAVAVLDANKSKSTDIAILRDMIPTCTIMHNGITRDTCMAGRGIDR